MGRLFKLDLIITCVMLFLDMMIFLIVGIAFDLVTVVGVDEMLHIFFVLSRYKWGNKPIKNYSKGCTIMENEQSAPTN